MMFKDQRASGSRDHCAFEAKILIDPTAPATSCMIKDISETGAKLQVASDVYLPDVFSVVLPVLDEIGDARPVCLRWRNGDFAGVRFVQSA